MNRLRMSVLVTIFANVGLLSSPALHAEADLKQGDAKQNEAKQSEFVYEGKVTEKDDSPKEIYVQTEAAGEGKGKKHEFYLKDFTVITSLKGQQGQALPEGKPLAASFEDIQKGTKVRVTAKKVGRRLDPLKIEILE